MTDKQIMIDDYFNIMRDDFGRIYCIQEIGNPKELIKAIREQNEYIEAKEQECEESKTKLLNLLGKEGLRQSEKEFYEQQLEAYKMEAEEGKEINAELKAENYYLKRKISQYENLLKLDFTKCRTAEEEVEHANYLRAQGAVVLTEENYKLKQTLAEIKEIVKEQLPTVNYNFAKSMHPEMFNCYEQILQKISECEV